MAYGNGLFVRRAAGSPTSPRRAWTARSKPKVDPPSPWTGEQFVAVGRPESFTSAEGVSGVRRAGVNATLRKLAWTRLYAASATTGSGDARERTHGPRAPPERVTLRDIAGAAAGSRRRRLRNLVTSRDGIAGAGCIRHIDALAGVTWKDSGSSSWPPPFGAVCFSDADKVGWASYVLALHTSMRPTWTGRSPRRRRVRAFGARGVDGRSGRIRVLSSPRRAGMTGRRVGYQREMSRVRTAATGSRVGGRAAQ